MVTLASLVNLIILFHCVQSSETKMISRLPLMTYSVTRRTLSER